MIEQLPAYVLVVFGLTTLAGIYFFYRAANNSEITLLILIAWIGLQSIPALIGFYSDTTSFPPRFVLLVLPAFITIAFLFLTKNGKEYLNRLNLKTLTWLHIIRIPVEFVLFWLFMHGKVPELMTFEGRNFDILSGISAPIIAFLYFNKKMMGDKMLLIWNIICLGLLINIVVNAILSAVSPFQQFAFEQPNTAVLYFPFIWLPCCIVPLALLSHLAAIRMLLKNQPFICSCK